MESVAALRPIRRRPLRVGAGLALAGALAACASPPDDRAVVERVVAAVAAGSASPVADAFTPGGARQLADPFRFRLAHDALAGLGKLQAVTASPEASASGGGAYRREAFVATFEGGTKRVDATFDSAGKIAALWIR